MPDLHPRVPEPRGRRATLVCDDDARCLLGSMSASSAQQLRKKRKNAGLGSRSVGKSSLVVRFVEDAFVDSDYPTIENVFEKTVK